jgi:AraC family transcriptional regulator of adaptative response/methylated-DNA-[protein]-cysteine methyltransferase
MLVWQARVKEASVASDYDVVKAAIIYIDENAASQPTLEDVAAHVGLGPSHFQRLFKRWAGVSPKRFLQRLTATRAKALLRESASVLDASFAVGLSSPSRLHDLLVTTEAVTPGEYRSLGDRLTIRYGADVSPFGTCFVGLTDRGVCGLRFVDDAGIEGATEELCREWPRSTLVADDSAVSDVVDTIFRPARRDERQIMLLLKGTNFQLKVWEALLRVPDGSLVSYGDLARRVGMPSSARAVANAVGANPIAYVIPCHRVLRSTGALGGYAAGTDRKLVMLERELARQGKM